MYVRIINNFRDVVFILNDGSVIDPLDGTVLSFLPFLAITIKINLFYRNDC